MAVLRQRLGEQQVPLGGRHRAVDEPLGKSFEIFGRQFHGVVAQVIERLRIHREWRGIICGEERLEREGMGSRHK